MPFSIKTKIGTGIGVLFVLLLIIAVVAVVAINLLSNKTENLLTANYKSIRYCNQMMQAVDRMKTDSHAIIDFERALWEQEGNVTEPGEAEVTQSLRGILKKVKVKGASEASIDSLNAGLYLISHINQEALERKNARALEVAEDAKLWLSGLATLVLIAGFTLAVNLPQTIARPMKLITEGIRDISKKNYRKRILIYTKDEFGEMAAAFNSMAERLDEWEHSSYARLSFEKARVDSIISQMEDAVIGLDAEGRILFLNEAAAALFNLNAHELSGKSAEEVAKTNDLLRMVLAGNYKGPVKIIVEGKEQFYTLNHKPVVRDQKPLGDVYSLKNITQFKELDLSKTNLLATISHELKTPISSIKMSATLLEDARTGQLNAEQSEIVHGITEDAERLLRLTGELLNMTQLETGNIQLKFQNISPRSIVEESVSAISVQAQQKGITIRTDIPEALPLIQVDADKVVLVLVNLLTNAIRYSPEQGVVSITLREQGESVFFEVKDNGEGIDPKYVSRIFDRYFKVPGSINKSGTGLGLAISKEFIQAQGGDIFVESEPGQGSTFWFELPVA